MLDAPTKCAFPNPVHRASPSTYVVWPSSHTRRFDFVREEGTVELNRAL